MNNYCESQRDIDEEEYFYEGGSTTIGNLYSFEVKVSEDRIKESKLVNQVIRD